MMWLQPCSVGRGDTRGWVGRGKTSLPGRHRGTKDSTCARLEHAPLSTALAGCSWGVVRPRVGTLRHYSIVCGAADRVRPAQLGTTAGR